MSFADPGLLLLLLVVPTLTALLVAAQRRRRRYAVRLPAAGTLAALAPTVPQWRRHVPAVLLLAAITTLVIAAARPQQTVAVPVEEASVLLVNDRSRSMLATDVAPSRLAAAQSAALQFLDEVPDELRVGAVSYSSGVTLAAAPTTDRDAVRRSIEGLDADGGTATGDALTIALRALRPSGRPRTPAAIVLLSDGATTIGSDPLNVAQNAARLGVPVYTVALGTDAGTVPDPRGFGDLPVPPDPQTLAAIAELSGGQAFGARDAEGLSRVYKALGSQLGTRDEEQEITAGFTGAGLALLAAALGLAIRRRPVLA